jgi:hypothetical protein
MIQATNFRGQSHGLSDNPRGEAVVDIFRLEKRKDG